MRGDSSMRVLCSGGGTGGHIYPALAVIKKIKQHYPDAVFLYIGCEQGLESKLVPMENIPFRSIKITGFRRSLSIQNLRTIFRFLKGIRTSKKILREFNPHVVLGTGGYVCGPVLYAAAKLGIPTMIHEQNAVPGLTNSFLSRYVDVVAVSFPHSKQAFSKAKKVIYTGNPTASTAYAANGKAGFHTIGVPDHSRVVLMVGGSKGAEKLKQAFVDMLPMLDKMKDIRFVYVTGERYFNDTVEAVHLFQADANTTISNVNIVDYIHNMPEVLACTQLIVSRAGASFLAEITALGIPSILIPSPNVTNNHQEVNARMLKDQGAAKVILEQHLDGPHLYEQIVRIMHNTSMREQMANAARKLGNPDAAQQIFTEMFRFIRRV